MGYPFTTIKLDDQTVKQTIPEVNTLAGKPVLMTVSSSDKGPEDFRTIDSKYIERYGNISFAKHGQAQAQIARILSAGGAIYHHRIVAPDSALANWSLVATTGQSSEQKKDSNGALLYETADGVETTAAEGNTPIMINKATVKYEVVSVTDLATLIKIGDDPKAIAQIVKDQVDVENETAGVTGSSVEKSEPDDLSTMGHATVSFTTAADATEGVATVVAKDDLAINGVYLRAGMAFDTINDFNIAAAVNVTDKASSGFGGLVVGNNTICVVYEDSTKYPPELFNLDIEDIAGSAEGTTVLDRSVLKALVSVCQEIENEDYTDDSWGNFQVALSAAVLAMDDDKNQDAVSTARVNLQYAKDSLATAAEATAASKKYVLFTITDTGRGYSSKRVCITPNYQASKSASYCKYLVTVLEGTESTDTTLMFSMNPDIIDSDKNRRLDSVLTADSLQLRGVVYENSVNDFFDDLAAKAGVDVDEAKEHDVLFGCTRKGKALDWLTVDATGVALNSTYGIQLKGGSNGSFGNAPMDSPDYYTQISNTFNGTASLDIYDIDNVKIHAIFDCGWPIEVKKDVEAFVSFREDIFYFRDLGLGLKEASDIIEADSETLKSKFCASYHNSYDVFDEITKKQITVTCMYHLAPLFIAHYVNGVNRPFAGILYNIVFDDVIEGSVNYIPKKIPSCDQPQELYDANINYMKYYDGILTMDTEKTSQEKDSELSYINNVLAVQDVIRDVRMRCPKIRYTFKSGKDFEVYQKDINQVLAKKSGFFDSLELVYLEDMAQTNPKCYFAAIKVDTKDFIESEYFKVSIINA